MSQAQTASSRLESFPFDSKADGYDADGYPVYDRAVGAEMLRSAFSKIFTNGVFGTPGNGLQIAKGSSGLTVTIQPGIALINGAMGGIDGEDPLELTLDTSAPQGNVCYGIMIRYDNTDNARSLYLTVVRGKAASTPQPPTPDTTTPLVYEMRLGYVTVPSNATDLSNATVTNEKGLAGCPFVAPFASIDVSTVIADAQAQAGEYLAQFNQYLANNLKLIETAIDGTTAGYLQNQIDELAESSGLSEESVDNVTIAYGTTESSLGVEKLYVKDGGITNAKLADGSVGTSELQNSAVTVAKILGSDVGKYLRSGSSGAEWANISPEEAGLKLLWSGSANTAEIQAPGISDYELVLVQCVHTNNMSEAYGMVVASKAEIKYGPASSSMVLLGGTLSVGARGSSADKAMVSYANLQESITFGANISGDTLTPAVGNASSQQYYAAYGNYTEDISIKSIWGLL